MPFDASLPRLDPEQDPILSDSINEIDLSAKRITEILLAVGSNSRSESYLKLRFNLSEEHIDQLLSTYLLEPDDNYPVSLDEYMITLSWRGKDFVDFYKN